MLAACDKGSSSPPKIGPAEARVPKDPCAAQIAEVDHANAAVKKAIADQKLEETTVEQLPMPFSVGITGTEPPAEDMERERREWAPFESKRTGDLVRWTAEGKPYEGIVIKAGEWHTVKRGTDLFLATPRSVRTVTCMDKTRPPSNCGDGQPASAFAVPPGMKFAGIIHLDVDGAEMDVTGADCQLPP